MIVLLEAIALIDVEELPQLSGGNWSMVVPATDDVVNVLPTGGGGLLHNVVTVPADCADTAAAATATGTATGTPVGVLEMVTLVLVASVTSTRAICCVLATTG